MVWEILPGLHLPIACSYEHGKRDREAKDMLTNWIDDHIVFIIPGLIVGVIVLVLLFDAFVRPILDDPGQSDADKE